MNVSASSPLPPLSTVDIHALNRSSSANVEEVAKSFEAVFASMLIKEMRNTLSEGFFGSEGSDVLGGLFDLHMGQAMTQGRGLGIQQMVMAQLEAEAAKS